MSIKFLIYIFFANFLFFYFFQKISEKLKIYSFSTFKDGQINKKTPLIGGFYILLNFNAYFFLDFVLPHINSNYDIIAILLLSNIFFILGYIDDRINLGPYTKLFLFLFLSIFLLNFFEYLLITELKFSFLKTIIKLNQYSLIFTIFSIFVFINAFNMFDGINGHSGIYAIFVFIVFFMISKNIIFIFFLIPFLIFLFLNLNDQFFIGNSGIFFLGLFISLIMISFYNNEYIIYSDDIFLIMFLPGIDLIRLFFIRVINKKNPFDRDLNHWHHILSNKFGNKRTLLISALFISLPFTISILNILSNILIILLSLFIYIYIILFCKNLIKIN